MNPLHNQDKTDALMSVIAYRCMEREAKLFLELDVSDIPDDPAFEKRIWKSIKKQTRPISPLTFFKLALVACLAVMSIFFAACICISDMREAMWNAWVEFYDDHIKITFEKPETTAPTADQLNASPALSNAQPMAFSPSSEIEHKVLPTYLPEGYSIKEVSTAQFWIVSDVYDSNSEFAFSITQGTIETSIYNVDHEKDVITYVDINGYDATLIKYGGVYRLVWQDECYAYALDGSFSSIDEMIKIAKSMKFR